MLKKYTAELDVYLAAQAKSKANTRFESVRLSLLNRPPILGAAVVIAVVVAIAQFTDALAILKRALASWFAGDG